VTCYLCGKQKMELLTARFRFPCPGKAVIKCSSCGLVQLWPKWTDAELKKLYRDYWNKKDFEGQKPKPKVSKYLAKMIRRGDRVLEIGCGRGDNLNYLRSKGFSVTGIDLDASVCDGDTITCADVRAFDPGYKPDFVYAMHLLEHLPDPRKFLRWLVLNLSKNGRFVLEVPCVEDPLLVLYKSERFSDFYWYPYHLFFFDRQSIVRLFHGYPELSIKVRPAQEYGILNHLRWLIFKRPGNALPTIPILDRLYKHYLTRVRGIGDTLIIEGHRV